MFLTARLVNTGWTAGGYGVGYRMKLKHTRAIIDAIHSGELAGADCSSTPIFGLQVGLQGLGVGQTARNVSGGFCRLIPRFEFIICHLM